MRAPRFVALKENQKGPPPFRGPRKQDKPKCCVSTFAGPTSLQAVLGTCRSKGTRAQIVQIREAPGMVKMPAGVLLSSAEHDNAHPVHFLRTQVEARKSIPHRQSGSRKSEPLRLETSDLSQQGIRAFNLASLRNSTCCGSHRCPSGITDGPGKWNKTV